jgi:hypothetical protein
MSSANFLWNHYREATKQISVLAAELAVIQSMLGLTDADFSRFLQEEHDYLDGLKQPPEQIVSLYGTSRYSTNLLNEGVNFN